MGRQREFDTIALLRQAGDLFIGRGYTATSIDEIVKATGVVRGSLYSIFGSKQGIFTATLELAAGQWSDSTADSGVVESDPVDMPVLLGLLNVAIFEIAAHNKDVKDLAQAIVDAHGITAQALGQRALDRAGLVAL